MQEKVCAIIVTWNSREEIKHSLNAIVDQVDAVLIIDNGSRSDELRYLYELTANRANVHIIENKTNRGIANAFNRGFHAAIETGFKWVITLDDNGRAGATMVADLLQAYHTLSPLEQRQTAIVAPNYTNIKGQVYHGTKPFWVDTTVSTGQLVKSAVWQETRGYTDELFIAGVDHDFCLKLRKLGYRILLVPDTTLFATSGPNPITRSLFGKKIAIPNYSSDRYYYTYRNDLYLYKNYWRVAPRWMLGSIISNLIVVLKIIIFENQKIKKMRMVVRGLADAIRNKLDKLD